MKLENIFAEAKSFEKLWILAQLVEPKISFWGSEYLVVNGIEGYLNIDSITKRVFELITKNHDFDESERNYGKKLASRIDYIYGKRDEILKRCNFFTTILVFLRNLSLHTSPRTYWQQYEGKYIFKLYTRSQFNKVFGYSIEEAEKRGFQLAQSLFDADRWCILPNSSN